MSPLHHPSDPVLFNDGIPSNFYPVPIELDCPYTHLPRTFPTTEHFFQAAKVAPHFLRLGDRAGYEVVAGASSPGRAKRFARRVPLSDADLDQWSRQGRSVHAMLAGNLVKYRTDFDCRAWLLDTGDRLLVEHRPDPVWGDNMDGSGQNLLGLTLMVVRGIIRLSEA